MRGVWCRMRKGLHFRMALFAMRSSRPAPPYVRRDRFKTLGRALGASDRILDAILGHPGKTVSDGYGDLTVSAKRRVIDSLPDYDLSDKSTGATRVT